MRPDLLKKLIHPETQKYNEQGTYVIWFFKSRKQRIVCVDDYFPCVSDYDSRSIFCSLDETPSGNVEIWPLLLEKAYAKIHQGYDAIDGGRPEHAIVDLTNGISELIDFEDEEFDEMRNDGSFW